MGYPGLTIRNHPLELSYLLVKSCHLVRQPSTDLARHNSERILMPKLNAYATLLVHSVAVLAAYPLRSSHEACFANPKLIHSVMLTLLHSHNK